MSVLLGSTVSGQVLPASSSSTQPAGEGARSTQCPLRTNARSHNYLAPHYHLAAYDHLARSTALRGWRQLKIHTAVVVQLLGGVDIETGERDAARMSRGQIIKCLTHDGVVSDLELM